MKNATLKKWSGVFIIAAVALGLVVTLAALGRKKDNGSQKENPSATETVGVVSEPTTGPTSAPTTAPTTVSTAETTVVPTAEPSEVTVAPTEAPTTEPVAEATTEATIAPTTKPTVTPTTAPTAVPTAAPTTASTTEPTIASTQTATAKPTAAPTVAPTTKPTTSTTTETPVGVAKPSTGISWDGKSPIIYTYKDGTTGTVPVEGATYESKPGITTTYVEYDFGGDDAVDGVYYCSRCGKACGDGSNGTCVRHLIPGEHTCSACGETIQGLICHTCDED